MLFDTLVICSFLVVLLMLRRLIGITPSLLACIIRWKENVNLEDSVKLSRDRDYLALAMIVPFCLIAFRYRLYSPGFIEPMSDDAVLGLYFAIFLAYLVLRIMVTVIFRPHKMPKKTFSTAGKAAFSFFIICTMVMLAVVGVMNIADAPDVLVRNAMLWISALIYVLFLIRKVQIFSTSCSVFVAFLYLCALEMIPTGILVVSAMIF